MTHKFVIRLADAHPSTLPKEKRKMQLQVENYEQGFDAAITLLGLDPTKDDVEFGDLLFCKNGVLIELDKA
jgi:hypothetical protein